MKPLVGTQALSAGPAIWTAPLWLRPRAEDAKIEGWTARYSPRFIEDVS